MSNHQPQAADTAASTSTTAPPNSSSPACRLRWRRTASPIGARQSGPPPTYRRTVAQAYRTAVEARLATRRASTLTQIDELARALDDIISATTAVATDHEHDPEGQTIALKRAQVASLLHQARSRLADLDAGARRLADGTYWHCKRCDQPIPAERLDARPTATTCIACASTQHR